VEKVEKKQEVVVADLTRKEDKASKKS